MNLRTKEKRNPKNTLKTTINSFFEKNTSLRGISALFLITQALFEAIDLAPGTIIPRPNQLRLSGCCVDNTQRGQYDGPGKFSLDITGIL